MIKVLLVGTMVVDSDKLQKVEHISILVPSISDYPQKDLMLKPLIFKRKNASARASKDRFFFVGH